MWIAKSVEALSDAERLAWADCQRRLRERGESVPLSQTLAWARATSSMGGGAYLIMNPEEAVGGVLHSVSPYRFECTNGPLLNWGREELPRQLATFAMAASKLSRRFESLALRPRWERPRFEERFLALPVEASAISQAATVHVAVAASSAEQERTASPRLRRTLVRSRKEGVVANWFQAQADGLNEFVDGMRVFGAARGFFVPEPSWFRSLLEGGEGITFYRVDAWHPQNAARTRLLIAAAPECAHYLFGFDERGKRIPSAISTAAVAHFRVLEECRRLGLPIYDLNGFASDESGSYAGVSRFKAQFGGAVVEYASPEIVIQA